MFERQAYQISFAFITTYLIVLLGQDLHEPAKTWLYLGLFVAIAHHTFVWLSWRLELIYKWISKTFGDRGFNLYVTGFFILFFGRLATTIMLAYYDQGSIPLSPILKWLVVLIIASLSGYTFYSVARYFGMKRAAGADHFFEEYKTMPFVKEGIFKYSSNSMYSFGTLVVLLPGLIGNSRFALYLGLFNYIYAWVHYFCLEKPDIKRIYDN